MKKTVGIIGYGHFGKFIETLAERFLPDWEVAVYSRRAEAGAGRFVTLAEACQSSVVILAAPIREYATLISQIVPLLGSDTIVVDVATVKAHTAQLLATFAYTDQIRYVSTHPMFGPYSYQKKAGDISDFRIVLAEHNLSSEESEQIVNWLSGLGFKVITMTPQEHDQQLAETLFLTHYLGQLVKEAGFVRTEIDTVSFGFLMDAMESVHNDEQLFLDVYRFNPYCEKVIKKLLQAERFVHDELLDYK